MRSRSWAYGAIGFVALIAVLQGPERLAAQSAVEGFVRSKTGEIVADAFVEARGAADTTAVASGITDRFGFFRLRLQPATYSLRITRIGYAEQTQSVEIKAAQATRVEIALEEQALEIGAVTVEAQRSRRTFEKS